MFVIFAGKKKKKFDLIVLICPFKKLFLCFTTTIKTNQQGSGVSEGRQGYDFQKSIGIGEFYLGGCCSVWSHQHLPHLWLVPYIIV